MKNRIDWTRRGGALPFPGEPRFNSAQRLRMHVPLGAATLRRRRERRGVEPGQAGAASPEPICQTALPVLMQTAPGLTDNNASSRHGRDRDPLTPQWRAALTGLSQNGRYVLVPFGRWCGERGVEPHRVTDADLSAFIADEEARGRVLPEGAHNCAVKCWNRQCARRPGLPQLARLPTERDERAVVKGRYAEGLRAEIERFVTQQYGCSPTAVTVRNRLYDGLDALFTAGRRIDSFAAFKNDAVLETFVKAERYGAINVASARRNKTLGDIRRLFIHLLNDPDGAAIIQSAIDALTKVDLDVTQATLEKIALFDDPETELTLLRAALEAGAPFAARPLSRSMTQAQAGIGVMIVLQLGAKPHELVTAAFTGPLRANATVVRPALMATINGEVENLDLALDEETVALVDQFWVAERRRRRMADVDMAAAPTHLFQTAAGVCKSRSALTVSFWRLTKAAIGVELSPQSLRDVLAAQLCAMTAPTEDYRIKDAFGYSWTQNFRLRYRLVRQRIAALRCMPKGGTK